MKVAWRSWCSPSELLPDIRWPFSQARLLPAPPSQADTVPSSDTVLEPAQGCESVGKHPGALGVCLGVSVP